MTVLFGTLGWRPQSLLPSIRSTSHLDRVAFYHSDHAKSRDARAPAPPDDVRRRTDPKAEGSPRVSRQEPREVVLGNGPGPRPGGPQGHDEPPSAQTRVDGHDRAPGRSG